MGDRLPMKLYSWLGACSTEFLIRDPVYVAASLSPEMFDRVIKFGPKVAQWLLAVAEAAEAIKRTASIDLDQGDSDVVG
jgi:hypothetical protein